MVLYLSKGFFAGLIFEGLKTTTSYPEFLAFLVSGFTDFRYQKGKKPCGQGWGENTDTKLQIQIQMYIYKNKNNSTDKYKSLLLLLPLDVNLVFLDNKKYNSVGLYLGRGGSKMRFQGFYSILYKIKQ